GSSVSCTQVATCPACSSRPLNEVQRPRTGARPAKEPAKKKSLPGLSGAIRLPVAARARKLHVGHFAFMRSVVQGLGVRQSWERYFRVEGDDSARHVKATIQWIRDEFAAAAKRQARPGTARLVLLDASRLGEPAAE